MAVITPNFNFSGQCGEAIELYRKAFHAEIGCLMRYGDANAQDMSDAWADTQRDWIYHAELLFGGQRIMLADHADLEFKPGLSLSLVVTLDTKADVMRAFEILSEGGSVIYPPHSTTYCPCTTNVVDRFGFRWCLMAERP
ncbi:MAG: VOC family protein [Clostridia bacterium]|nr:VOC family protein [Clostridia bacterium]